MKAVTHCTARFSRETADSFRSLYAKVDAEVTAPAASPEDAAVVTEKQTLTLENAARIDLKGAGFAQRYEVKTLGAQWDPNAKVWWVDCKTYASKAKEFSNFNPQPNDAAGFAKVSA